MNYGTRDNADCAFIRDRSGFGFAFWNLDLDLICTRGTW